MIVTGGIFTNEDNREMILDIIYDYLDVVDAVAIKVSHVRKAAEQFKEFGTRKYCEHEGE